MRKIFIFCIVILFLLPLPVNAEENQGVRISNISSSSVVVSWVADEKCIGTVNYGITIDNLSLSETDNSLKENCVIMVELKNLEANTTYYFEIVSGNILDNNNGLYFRTTEVGEISMPSRTLGGHVLLDNGENADGTMVYVTVEHDGINSAPLSCMVFNGCWMVELANLKHEDGTAFGWEVNDTLYIEIEGGEYGYKNITTFITEDTEDFIIKGYQDCTVPRLKSLSKPVTPEVKTNAWEYNRILIFVFCIVLCLIIVMVYLLRREKIR